MIQLPDFLKDVKSQWAHIYRVDGQLDEEAVLRELCDFSKLMEIQSATVEHVTGGKMGGWKLYDIGVIKAVIDDTVNDAIQEAIAESKRDEVGE